ncbi:MAG: hypothetical protein M0R68_03985 [Bacteroidetes bacterium]|nr:hypothetical protein [Bacteroidota bacterium]
MSGEATVETSTVVPEAPAAPVTTVETTVVPVPENAGPIDYVISDQGLPTVTDAELMGMDQDVPVVPDTPAVPDAPVVPAGKEQTTETPPATEAKVETPPKGYVPTAAVHEAREEIRRLKERISAMEVKGADVKPVTPPAVPDNVPTVRSDFKVLTKDEFIALSEESPRDALVYQSELMDFREAQRIAADKARQDEVAKVEVEELFEESAALMSAALPGIFDEGSTVQQELAQFADGIGFTKDLYYLTNPETQVILPGESKPLYLGRQAASIVAMLANLKNKGLPNADAAMRATVEAELRPKIEQEVLSKIKTAGVTGYKALSEIPTSATTTPESKILTEAEVAALDPKALEAYLSGM